MERRNTDIDFWKMYYAIIIVLFHFYFETKEHFMSGFLGVEFFFVTAGLFEFAKYDRRMRQMCGEETPYFYLIKRLKRLFPMSFVGFLFAVIVKRAIYNPTVYFSKLLDYFTTDIWEVFLVKMNGLQVPGTYLINAPAWSLCAMLAVQFLIWYALYHFDRRFLDGFMPLTILIGFGLWRNLENTNYDAWIGLTTFGLIRAWIEICLGWYTLKLAQRLEDIKWNKKGEFLLTAAELLLHGFALWIITHKDTKYYQWSCILAFVLACAISHSGHSLFNKLLNRLPVKLMKLMGGLSMSLYLSHYTILYIWKKIWTDAAERYSHKYSFALTAAIAAFGVYFAEKYGSKLCRAGLEKAKGVLIQNNSGK